MMAGGSNYLPVRAEWLNQRVEPPLMPDLPIVDAHHHLWDLKAGHYPTKTDQYDENFFLGDYRAICRDYMPSDHVGAPSQVGPPTSS